MVNGRPNEMDQYFYEQLRKFELYQILWEKCVLHNVHCYFCIPCIITQNLRFSIYVKIHIILTKLQTVVDRLKHVNIVV